ncbi:MAG: hypothetical protein U9Q06_03230 [Nanoarchaeota archaeon]|nr:hypothetical protein [Nanoarchaeota archaeon]
MPLLKEIASTDSGLVGITEEGEWVKLGVPIPDKFSLSGDFVNYVNASNVIESCARESKEYYDLTQKGLAVVFFNRYPKRVA